MAKKRVFVVYVIRNMLDGKTYIGKTSGRSVFVAIEARWKQHRSDALKGRGSYLHQAMRKHGVENFEVGHLHICKTERGAFALEVREIARFASEYNLTIGGEGCGGYKWTEDQRNRVRKPLSAERRAQLIGIRRGPPSPEHREKLRQAALGRIISQEQRLKISLAKKGKPFKRIKPYVRTKFTAAMIAHKAAREAGQKHYSGNPCKQGHGTLRYVSTTQCVECHRLWQMNYMPKWRQKQTEMHHV